MFGLVIPSLDVRPCIVELEQKFIHVSLNELWRTEADALPGQAPLPEPVDAMPPRLADDDQAQTQQAATPHA